MRALALCLSSYLNPEWELNKLNAAASDARPASTLAFASASALAFALALALDFLLRLRRLHLALGVGSAWT